MAYKMKVINYNSVDYRLGLRAVPAKVTIKGIKYFSLVPARPVAVDENRGVATVYSIWGENFIKSKIHSLHNIKTINRYELVFPEENKFHYYNEVIDLLDTDERFEPTKIGIYDLDKFPSYEDVMLELMQKGLMNGNLPSIADKIVDKKTESHDEHEERLRRELLETQVTQAIGIG